MYDNEIFLIPLIEAGVLLAALLSYAYGADNKSSV
jgi:hypothetical protein